jgi:hypothetical protein
MRRITIEELNEQKVAELGLDPKSTDLTSIEAISGSIRRVASFACPCSASTLVRNVVLPMRGLVSDPSAFKELTEDTLEAVVAHGDIQEFRNISDEVERGQSILLYAAPASFVVRSTGSVIFLGVTADHLSVLTEDMASRIEYVNHLRRLAPRPGEVLRDELTHLGLIELSYQSWLKSPPAETPSQLLSRYDALLDRAVPSREITGLTVIDPARPVRYYRGRWSEPKKLSGRFVGRRRQAYGADLWCYVQLQEGLPERMIDLPAKGSRWRGCDEAWRLQMALDSLSGNSQQYIVASGLGDRRLLKVFSPVPMWARRRWDAVGEPLPSSDCLFSYRFPEAELAEELRFAREALWLSEVRPLQQSQKA